MTKFANLKKGEILSETQFYTVEKIVGDKTELVNQANEHIVVDKGYVDSCLISGVQFSKEEKITRTDLAAKFIAASDVALTVNFNTKVDPKVVTKEIMDKVTGAAIKDIEKAIAAGVKRSIEGEERTMKGYHKGVVNEFGRVNFTDLEIPQGQHNLRQVDPRTINWLILKDVKYSVK